MGYVNRFSRGVYRVQKELVEKASGKYFEAGFGADDNQERQETTQEKPKKKLSK